MSRSRHQTVKGVFGGKPAREINAMIAGDDQDVQALREKTDFKSDARQRRAAKQAASKLTP